MINFDAIGSGPKTPPAEPSIPIKSNETGSGEENSFKEMLRDIKEVDSTEIVHSDDSTAGDENFDEDIEENKSGLRILKLLKGEQLPFNTKERPDNVIYSFKDLLSKQEPTKISINESFVNSEVLGDTDIGETVDNAPELAEQETDNIELPKAKNPNLFEVLEKSVKYLPDNVKSRVSNFIEKNSNDNNIINKEIPDSGPDENINETLSPDLQVKDNNDNVTVKAAKPAEIIAKPEKGPDIIGFVNKDNKTSEKPAKESNKETNVANSPDQKNELKDQKPTVQSNRISSLSPLIHNNITRLLNNNVFNKRVNQQEPETFKDSSRPVITDSVPDNETVDIPVINAKDSKAVPTPVNKPATHKNHEPAKPVIIASNPGIIEKGEIPAQAPHVFKQTPKIYNEQTKNIQAQIVKTNDNFKQIPFTIKETISPNNKNPESPAANKPVQLNDNKPVQLNNEIISVNESPVDVPDVKVKEPVNEPKAPEEVRNEASVSVPVKQDNLNVPINKEIIPDKKENTFLNIDKIRFSYSTYYKPEPAIISKISGTISAKSFLERVVENLKKYEPSINYKSISFSPRFRNFFVPQKKNAASTSENTNISKPFIFSPVNKGEIEEPSVNTPLTQPELIIPPIGIKVEKEIEKIAAKLKNPQNIQDTGRDFEPEIFGDQYSNDKDSDNRVTLTSFEVDYDPKPINRGTNEISAPVKSEKQRVILDDPSMLPALLSSSQIIKLINDGVPLHFSIIPEVIKEIVTNVAKINQNITLNINLNPFDLGEINLMIKLTDGKQMTVMFETSSARVQSIVESYFQNIKNIIKDNSFVVHEVSANVAATGVKPVTPRERNNSSGGFSSNNSDSEHSPGQTRRKRKKEASEDGETEDLKVDI